MLRRECTTLHGNAKQHRTNGYTSYIYIWRWGCCVSHVLGGVLICGLILLCLPFFHPFLSWIYFFGATGWDLFFSSLDIANSTLNPPLPITPPLGRMVEVPMSHAPLFPGDLTCHSQSTPAHVRCRRQKWNAKLPPHILFFCLVNWRGSLFIPHLFRCNLEMGPRDWFSFIFFQVVFVYSLLVFFLWCNAMFSMSKVWYCYVCFLLHEELIVRALANFASHIKLTSCLMAFWHPGSWPP